MSIFDAIQQSGAFLQRKLQVNGLIGQLNDNEKEDRERYPEDAPRWQPFLKTLRAALEEYKMMTAEEPVDASVRLYVTRDKMNAYGCILPPMDGGKELSPAALGKALQENGVSAGIDQELSASVLVQKFYLHIFPIARGSLPQDGTDGSCEYLFEPQPVFQIDVREGKTADFSVLRPVQLIRRGEPVCRITLPTPGKEGSDVTGRKFPCRAGSPVTVFEGRNTALSEDGTRLEATENGAVYVDKNGEFFVQTACLRPGGLTANDNLVWLTYVDGDIAEGVKVESTSSILVMGEIRGAEIHSNGSVRAQKGILKGTEIDAKGQVLSPLIQDARIRAGKDVYAEQIIDSEVSTGGGVFVLGGEGVVKGGVVRAHNHVECIRVGDQSGRRNQFIVGWIPELDEEISRLSAELGETQKTLEKLRKNVVNLRIAGEALSLEKKELLGQLNEQKCLYETRAAELEGQLKAAKEKLRESRSGRVLCRELNPVTEVRIGDRTSEFKYPEANCNIRVYMGQVVSK